jgi:iron complex outermembrane receptor protein
MKSKHVLCSSTAAIALVLGTGGALGQTAPTVAQAAPAAGLEEVVVTAEKRSENLQKAPLVITAVDAEALAAQHVVNSQDLMEVAPELHIDSGGPSSVFSMRGIGSSATGPNGSPGVTINENGPI